MQTTQIRPAAVPLALLVFALAFMGEAHALATAGNVTLTLRDASQRPVVGATVALEYTSTAPNFGALQKREVLYSDAHGIVSRVVAADLGTPMTVNASHHGAVDVSVHNWSGTMNLFVNLPLADFGIIVIDSQSLPIPNVPLELAYPGNESHNFTTDSEGYMLFGQYDTRKSYTVRAFYGPADLALRIVPDGNLRHAIQFRTNTLETRTYGDDGSLLFSTVTVYYKGVGDEARSSQGTLSTFRQIPSQNVTVVARYGNKSITDAFNLTTSALKRYVFDFTPPSISEPALAPADPVPENSVSVSVQVTDQGIYASGMPPLNNSIPPVELFYSLDGENWDRAYMFPQPDGATYKGRIPGQPAGSVVRYYVVAYDNERNTARSPTYSFNTFIGTPPGNQTGGQWEGLDRVLGTVYGERLPLLAALAIIVVVYALSSYFAPFAPREEE
ncbi:MAG: hypothetical protein PHF51_01320 [Candidatus ainarchaeum sp.]|nr:hypothetical protein [Candidatus ainarchaeum sp.]